MHDHGVIRQATKVGLAMHMERGDRVLAHMPFHHVAGLFMAFVPAIALGAALIPMSEWNTLDALELIERLRITAFGGIPTHYYDLVDVCTSRSFNTSSIKAAWIGGSPVPKETFEKRASYERSMIGLSSRQ